MIQTDKFPPRKIAAAFLLFFFIGYLLISWLVYNMGDYGPIGFDIYPRWVGNRAFWRGESPYSDAVDLETQQYVFGRPAQGTEDSFGYYYPAHTAVVLAPIIFLPASWAALLWTAAMWAILGLAALFIIASLPPRSSPLLWTAVLLSLLLNRTFLLSIINGQYTFYLIALWGIAYYCVRHKKDGLAGLLLALTTIKPSLTLLPLLVLLGWALLKKRRHIVGAFILTSAALFLITLLQIGWWVPQFLAELAEYGTTSRTWKPTALFTLPGLYWLAASAGLIAMGIRSYLKDKATFPWDLLWGTISLNLLLTPHTATYDLVFLLLPFLIFAPRYLQTIPGLLAWLLALWLPWITWGAFTAFGYTVDIWYASIWLYYPQVLTTILLLSARKKSKD